MTSSLTSIDAVRPVTTVAQYTRIRDQILIDETLKAKLEDPNTPFYVNLIVRVNEHKPDVHLVMPGEIVPLILSPYDEHGCTMHAVWRFAGFQV